MDLVGPTKKESRGGRKYFLVIVDDYSRFTWVAFLREKSDAYAEFKKIVKRIQVEKGRAVARIRSDHGGEFVNAKFEKYCDKYGIHHEFSAPKTPQQNGVAERKNRFLQEIRVRKFKFQICFFLQSSPILSYLQYTYAFNETSHNFPYFISQIPPFLLQSLPYNSIHSLPSIYQTNRFQKSIINITDPSIKNPIF